MSQSIPYVFQEIIKNDAWMDNLKRSSLAGVCTRENWVKMKELRMDKKHNLIPSAEKALRWNTDKGAS